MNKKRLLKIKNRSGFAICDICKETAILVSHHIDGRDINNADHPSNLVSICPNCHMEVHYGVKIIEGWLMTTGGRKLFWHKKGEEAQTDRTSSPYIIPTQKN